MKLVGYTIGDKVCVLLPGYDGKTGTIVLIMGPMASVYFHDKTPCEDHMLSNLLKIRPK
jgi:hypothetical protein